MHSIFFRFVLHKNPKSSDSKALSQSFLKKTKQEVERNVEITLQDVTKIINFIKGHALIHREFNSCLDEIDYDLTGLLDYTDVRWLSKTKWLLDFFKNT